MSHDTPDSELLEAWQRGDRASGEILLGRYIGPLTSFFRKRVSDPERVADLVSETMLRCVKSKQTVRRTAAFRSFLFACGMNILHHYSRKKAKRNRESDDFADLCAGHQSDVGSLDTMISRKQEGVLLVRALRGIPLEQQIVLELSYVEDLSGPEIAKLLDIPKSTVYTRLRRGTKRLRALVPRVFTKNAENSSMIGMQTWASGVRKLQASG